MNNGTGGTTSRLGLGTVQFGQDYGISNTSGQTTREEARVVLDLAGRAGVPLLDTAAHYGASETVLGGLLPTLEHAFRIVTKVPSLAQFSGQAKVDAFVSSVEQSFLRLGVPRLHGLLLHDAGDLMGEEARDILSYTSELKQHGSLARFGISAYVEADVDAVLEQTPIELLQVPLNVFDQRLVHSGALSRFSALGLEVHIRSAFLQGVVFMQPESLPAHLIPLAPQLRSFHAACDEAGISPACGALGYVLTQPSVAAVLMGVNTSSQLQELLQCAAQAEQLALPWASFAANDTTSIDPRRWPQR